MKLLYLANIRMPTGKAHGVQIAKSCESLTRAGVTVELLVPKRYTPIEESPERYYDIKTPFTIHFFHTPDVVRSFGRFGFLLQTLFLSVAAARYIRTQKYDIVYCRDEHVLSLVLLLGIKRVVWESHDGSWNRAAQYVARRAKHMVVVTDAQRQWYIAHGVSEEKIIALPNGIDVDAFAHTESKEVARARLGLPQDAFIALYVGALGGWKGTDTLFSSASLLPEHIRIAVIGGAQQQREAAALQYPKIIFLGERPYRELQDNLAAADLCVLPNTAHDPISVSFTSPLKLLAYMASGKPIVASDLPSVRELVGDTAAWLMEPDNPQALAAGIERVAIDRALASRLVQSARERVQNFDWQTRAKRLLAFIESPLRVCYLNITPSDFSRGGVHMRALMLKGARIFPCIDNSPGVRKFWEIFKKHRALRGEYDVIVVGYPGYILVPFAQLLSRKPVLFDAGWSLYEGTIVTRKLYARQPLKRLHLWLIDSIAYHSADLVLLESEQQIEYYSRLLRVGRSKCRLLFTGVDESQFYFDPTIQKNDIFTVLFRGYANIDDGSDHVLAAARVLQDEGIQFLIISPNFRLKKDLPPNVELREGFFDIAKLRAWMQSCQVSIGHVSANERLERTIPHKAFESMVLRIPFMISDGAGVRELFSDDNAVLVKPGSVVDIVEQIRKLKNDPAKCVRLADNAFAVYKEKCSNDVLGEELLGYIRSMLL